MQQSWFKQLILGSILILFIKASMFAKTPTPTEWKPLSVQLPEQQLSLFIPPNPSKDFPPSKTVTSIRWDQLSSSKRPFIVFEQYWDYRGFFWQGVRGTLSMKIFIRQAPNDFSGNLKDLKQLQQLTEHRLNQAFSKNNQRRQQQGQTQFIVTLPQNYNSTTVGKKSALQYALGGQYDMAIYAIPLTSKHYLQLQFDFIDNSRKSKTDWRQQAQQTMNTILESVEFKTTSALPQ